MAMVALRIEQFGHDILSLSDYQNHVFEKIDFSVIYQATVHQGNN